ncbi:ECF transporter S component [Candidatus Phytoplasma prunorum]|uniref:ECF transporter S component n=1 Tax=Candidatus Phytoplasma prunorum TaxID=47565 RepID=UPI002FEEFA00
MKKYNLIILKQIILTSLLSALSIVLVKMNNIIQLNIQIIKFRNYDYAIKFLPLIIMSFYVPFYLSFLGSFLSETLGFFLINNNQKYTYNPIISIIIAILFGVLPGLILKKKNNYLKFYIFFILISFFYQIFNTLSFIYFNIYYYHDNNNINFWKTIEIKYILSKSLSILITPFFLTFIIKKIINSLNFFDEIIK